MFCIEPLITYMDLYGNWHACISGTSIGEFFMGNASWLSWANKLRQSTHFHPRIFNHNANVGKICLYNNASTLDA